VNKSELIIVFKYLKGCDNCPEGMTDHNQINLQRNTFAKFFLIPNLTTRTAECWERRSKAAVGLLSLEIFKNRLSKYCQE